MSTKSLVRRSLLCALVLSVALLATPPANATITPATTAGQLSSAMAASPGLVTGSSFVTVSPGTPNAVADAASGLGGFPREGASYAIMTSGDANLADDANGSASSGANNSATPFRTTFDATVLKVDVNVPSGANCLAVDFRFLSEEYPEYVGNQYNDAFIAELGANDWSIGANGAINAPHNFAFGPDGKPITINTTGVTAMSAGEASGTTYDGATPLLQANTPVTSGATSVYFSIFDQGDGNYDSAVFLDSLVVGTVASGACVAGATLAIKNLQLTTSDPSTAPGVDDAALANLPANKIAQRTPPSESAPIGRAPIGRAPIGRAPIGRAPIGRAPIGRAPIGRAPIGRAPIGRAPIGRATLASFPLNVPGGWATILTATQNLTGATPQGVTLFQLFSDPYATDGNKLTLSQLDPRCAGAPGDTTPPAGCSAFALSLSDMNVAGSPLENVSLLSFLLGDLTWNDIVAPGTGWCAEWTAVSSLPCDTTRTIFDSEAEGVPLDLTSLPVRSVGQITGDGLKTRAVFWSLTLRDLNIPGTYLAGVKLADIAASGNLAAVCSGAICSSPTATLLDARNAGALTNTGTLADLGTTLNAATLSDVVLMVIDPIALEWESLPLLDAGFEGMPENDPTNLVDYSLRFDLGCADAPGLLASVGIPSNFRYRAGSSTLGFNGGSQTAIPNPVVGQDGVLNWDLSSNVTGCAGSSSSVRLDFRAMPGFTLGTFGSTATVRTTTIQPTSVLEQAPVTIYDPGNSEGPDTAALNHLYVGYLGAGETDFYDVTVPVGDTLSVTLSHQVSDYDLTVYAPDGADTQGLLRNPGSVVPIAAGSLVTDPPNPAAGVLAPPALEGMHLEPGRVVAGISSLRGTEQEGVTTTAVAGTGSATYTIQVSGHNGTFGNEPYVLILRDAQAYSIPPCISLPAASAAPTLPWPSSAGPGDKTLYLVNEGALVATFGAADAASIVSAVQTLALTPEGDGLVVPIDANAAANTALDAYRANPCSLAAANAAVRKTNDAIDSIGGLGSIENVVLIGDDAIFPHAALADGTVDGNESGFAGDVVFTSSSGAARSNHLTAAFAANSFLSDAPYATPHPVQVLGQVVYVPQWAFGRLGGSAGDIRSAITNFNDANGQADPASAVTAPRRALAADYDFMADGGQQIFDRLAAQVGSSNAVHLFGNWSRGDVLAQFLQASNKPHVVSLNAHYDQYRMLPGAGNAADASSLVTTADVDAATGLAYRILFSIGCHFGLDIANAYPGSPSDPRARDWAEAYAHAGVAAMVGNLGYGYGDTATVAFSERLMADFAANLDGSMSLGQGLNAAEQDYFSSASAVSPYDLKVLQQTVLWGIPMYSPTGPLPAAAAAAFSASSVAGPAPDPQTGGLSTTSVSVAPSFTQQTAPDGRRFFEADGQTEAIHPYPIMPKTVDALPTAAGLVAHGAVPIALTRTEQSIDIAFANATIDRSSLEPATAYETVYPLTSRIASGVSADGSTNQNLVVIPAEFASDDDLTNPASLGTFGRYTSSQWLVTYGPVSGDFTPPQISEVTVGSGGAISARVSDDSGSIVRVFAQVLKGDGTFERVELSGPSSGGVFGGTTTASVIRAISIYAVDDSGNTAAAHDKQLGFVPSGGGGDTVKPLIEVFTPPSTPAIYNLNQTVAELYACTDVVDPAPTCTDSNAGANLDTSTPGAHVFTVTSTDEAGNTAKVSRTYYVRFVGFQGFFSPVDNLPTVNVAKAGNSVPLKWRVLDANGVPISNASHFLSVTSTTFGSCSGVSDAIETYSGGSGLQYLGSGNWQFNWSTKKAWAGSCREVILNLNDGTPGGRGYVAARFTFK